MPLPSTSGLVKWGGPQGRKDYSRWNLRANMNFSTQPHSRLTFLWGYSHFISVSFLFFHPFHVLERSICYIRELFISCQEVKNNFCKHAVLCHLFCVFIFCSLSQTHIFHLPICCKPVWNRISWLLCLVQQAYTYFSPSQNAGEPLILNAPHIVNTYSHKHRYTDRQLLVLLCIALVHHSAPICLL